MKCKWLVGAVVMAALGTWAAAQNNPQDPNQNPQQSPQQSPTHTQPQSGPQKTPPTDQTGPKASDVQNAPKQNPASLPTKEDDQIKHDGGKNDVDAVGNRNVGCGRGVGNWYSVERQVAMGRGDAQQIESQIKLVNDPVITEYVNRVGQNLVRNSDAQVPFTIKVIDSDVVNAMALPGGFF